MSTRRLEWRIVQRYALACIYYATNGVETQYYIQHYRNDENDTSSVVEWEFPWADRAGTINECNWYGVQCEIVDDSLTFALGEGQVIAIDLSTRSGIGITGTFPMEVILLKETLEVIALSNNPVSNNGWEWLGELTQLQTLRVDNTGFGYDQGLPTELGILTNLETLDLSNSWFTGRLNASTVFSNLSKLRTLSLEGLENLTHAHTVLDYVPTFRDLRFLTLSHISFQTEISLNLFDLPQLQELSMSHANLTGNLDVLFNYSASIESFHTNLRVLELSHNPNLGGTLPSVIGQLSQLKTLDLAHCGLTGFIPSELKSVVLLDELRLDHNALNGSFPFHLMSNGLLSTVSLQNNNLTGGLEPMLGKESMDGYFYVLDILDLDNNVFLGGTIPSSIGLYTSLDRLGLSNCGLTGSIPSHIGLILSMMPTREY